MAKTFMDSVAQAKAATTQISVEDAKVAIESEENILVIDVRDASDIAESGIIPGAAAISLGSLNYKADTSLPAELQHPELGDHDRPIIVTCAVGAMASLGGQLLQEMGYKNVRVIESGTNGWKEAGNDVEAFS